MKNRIPIWLAVWTIVLAGTISSGGPFLYSQETAERELPGVELHPTARGYLGIRRIYRGLFNLTQFDAALRDSISRPFYGVEPQALHPLSGSPGAESVILLGRAGSVSSLFTIPIPLGRLQVLVPFWSDTLAALTRIVDVGDFDRDGRPEVVLAGPSAWIMVGLDGRERHRATGDLLDVTIHRSDTTRLIVVRQQGSSVFVEWVNAATGRTDATRSIEGSGGRARVDAIASRGVIAVTTGGATPAVHVVDLAKRSVADPIPLPAEPLAVVVAELDGTPTLAALLSDYPSPSFFPLVPGAEPQPIEYPLRSVVSSVLVAPGFICLAGRDSVAIYDRSMRLLDTAAIAGAAGLTVAELDSGRLLLASPAGSRIVTVDRGGSGWLERNWQVLTVIAIVAIVGVLMVGALRRYRFEKSIYDNLVSVPNTHGIVVMSSSQRVKHINASARGMLGIAPYIPMGRHVSEYLDGEQFGGVVGALRRLFADGISFEHRTDVTTEAGARAVTFRGRPMLSRYGLIAGYLLQVEDVTKTLEQERLVNWASVAHHIAHEMKTPLGTVRMTAEMLRDRLGSNGNDSEYLRATNRILKQSDRLRNIVEDLLSVARTESLQKVNADLSLLLPSLAHEYHDYLPASIELRLEINGDDFHCHVDVQQLTVALRNLLDNARHAIGARDEGRILFGLTTRGEEILITVEDNGVGMAPATLAQLFQPFYTEREGGSGIGTVIVKRVIEAHGGAVQVDSHPGRGTRFVLTFPKFG